MKIERSKYYSTDACPKCGNEAIIIWEPSSLVIGCPKCDFLVASSRFHPIYEDETVYQVILQEAEEYSADEINVISKITGENYLWARRKLKEGGTIISGIASQINENVDLLKEHHLPFTVIPDWPYYTDPVLCDCSWRLFPPKIGVKRIVSKDDRASYSHMLDVFKCLSLPDDYWCLITDAEAYPKDDAAKKVFDEPVVLLRVRELLDLLATDNCQFVWGCFSIFDSKKSKYGILMFELPIGKDNGFIYEDYPVMQHPLALLEINSFDSSELVFLSDNDDYCERIKTLFPEAKEC